MYDKIINTKPYSKETLLEYFVDQWYEDKSMRMVIYTDIILSEEHIRKLIIQSQKDMSRHFLRIINPPADSEQFKHWHTNVITVFIADAIPIELVKVAQLCSEVVVYGDVS